MVEGKKVVWFRIGDGDDAIIRGIEYPEEYEISELKEKISIAFGTDIGKIEEIP